MAEIKPKPQIPKELTQILGQADGHDADDHLDDPDRHAGAPTVPARRPIPAPASRRRAGPPDPRQRRRFDHPQASPDSGHRARRRSSRDDLELLRATRDDAGASERADQAADATATITTRSSASSICASRKGGQVTSTKLLKSTAYPAYDEKLVSAVRSWDLPPVRCGGTVTPGEGLQHGALPVLDAVIKIAAVAEPVIEVKGPPQDLPDSVRAARRVEAAARRDVHRSRRGQIFGFVRPQRCRQDHDDPHADGPQSGPPAARRAACSGHAIPVAGPRARRFGFSLPESAVTSTDLP